MANAKSTPPRSTSSKRSRAATSSDRSSAAKRSSPRARSSAGTRSASPRRSSGGNRSAASRPSASRRSKGDRRNGKGQVDAVKGTLSSGAQSARQTVARGTQNAKGKVAGGAKTTGNALGTAAEKSRGPAVAGGAALAGLAGGLAIATRAGRRRVLGVPIPLTRRPLIKVTSPRRYAPKGIGKDLMKAAEQVGSAGRHVGDLASEVRLVREQLQTSRRRSPVEVVLEGLTSRRVRG
jgi:hypothetical protein